MRPTLDSEMLASRAIMVRDHAAIGSPYRSWHRDDLPLLFPQYSIHTTEKVVEDRYRYRLTANLR
jgi:hypothetical protein